jgi:hypothetical protein
MNASDAHAVMAKVERDDEGLGGEKGLGNKK